MHAVLVGTVYIFFCMIGGLVPIPTYDWSGNISGDTLTNHMEGEEPKVQFFMKVDYIARL